MVTVAIEGADAADVQKQMAALLHGGNQDHHISIQPTLVVDAPKELKREKKSKETAAPAETKEETATPTTGAAHPAGPAYSAVQEIVPKVLKVVKRDALLLMFAKFGGAKSARELKPEDYQEFINDAQALIDAAPKA